MTPRSPDHQLHGRQAGPAADAARAQAGRRAGLAVIRTAAGAARAAADLLLPRACALCEAALRTGERGLCEDCRLALPGRGAQRCATCAARLPRPAPCPVCARLAPAFGRALALADYAAPLDRLIIALKYRGRLALAAALGEALAPLAAPYACRAGCVVLGVPPSAQRLRERGYDHVGAIAARVARRNGLRAPAGLLARARDTLGQPGLGLAARRANLRDAFLASDRVRGLEVLLVDDVMTTGATLQSATLALLGAGATRVDALVAARTA